MHFIPIPLKNLLELFNNTHCTIEAEKQVTHHPSGENMNKECYWLKHFLQDLGLVAERFDRFRFILDRNSVSFSLTKNVFRVRNHHYNLPTDNV